MRTNLRNGDYTTKKTLDDNSYRSLLKLQAERYNNQLGREYDAESGVKLLMRQNENIENGKVAIINTSVLFFVDYLGKDKVLS